MRTIASRVRPRAPACAGAPSNLPTPLRWIHPTLATADPGRTHQQPSCCLSPGIQERAQRLPVGDIHKESADPDPDLSLARSRKRDDDLDMHVLGPGGHDLAGDVESVVGSGLA